MVAKIRARDYADFREQYDGRVVTFSTFGAYRVLGYNPNTGNTGWLYAPGRSFMIHADSTLYVTGSAAAIDHVRQHAAVNEEDDDAT